MKGEIFKRIVTLSWVLLLLISSLSFSSSSELIEYQRGMGYLTAATRSPIEHLNPLTITDVWSSYAAKDPIYDTLSYYHEENEIMIPWVAYDWSPMGVSGGYEDGKRYDPLLNYDQNGVYDPSKAYIDTDPTTVENEAIPSAELEVVVRLRPNILYHRAGGWEEEIWTSPKNTNFSMPMDKMRYVTAHDIVFTGEMLQWDAPLYKTGFLPLAQDTSGDRGDAKDSNWVVNGGTGMYEGMQLYDMGGEHCDYSIRFELDRPYSLFFHNSLPLSLSMKVWAEHTLLDIGSNNALNWDLGQGSTIEDQRRAMVGTGPFMWTDWDPGNYISLDTNPDYWVDGTLDPDRPYGLSLNGLDYRPWIDGLEFIIRSTTDAAVLSLERGEVDVLPWSVDPGYITRLQQHPNNDVMSSPDFGVYYMGFNMREPAFGYKDHPGAGEQIGTWYGEDISYKFRQAVSHAIDRSYIVNNILQGYGTTTYSLIPSSIVLHYNRSIHRYPFDLDKTKQLLEEQNEIWREELDGFNTVWLAKDAPAPYPIPRRDAAGNIYEDTNTFYLLTPTADYDPVLAKSGQLIADTLREEIGLNILSRPMIFQTLFDRLDPRRSDFDLYIAKWERNDFESLNTLEKLLHSRNDVQGSYNFAGARNESIDSLIEKAEMEMGSIKRIRYLKEIDGHNSINLHYLPIYGRSQVNAYNNDWTGWVAWPGGIWNRFSWSNIWKTTPLIRISVPETVIINTEHDVTIRLFDRYYNPREGVEFELITTHTELGANFTAKTDPVTDKNGVINATFIAPDVISRTTVLLTAKVADNDRSYSKTVNVSPDILPSLYLEVNIDRDIIYSHEKATITLELMAYQKVDNASVHATIYPEVGNPELEPEFPLMLSTGESIEVTFQARRVHDLQRYTIEFEAVKSGYESSLICQEILIEEDWRPPPPPPPPPKIPIYIMVLPVILLASVAVFFLWRGKKEQK